MFSEIIVAVEFNNMTVKGKIDFLDSYWVLSTGRAIFIFIATARKEKKGQEQ
jgi:hypothetical protein